MKAKFYLVVLAGIAAVFAQGPLTPPPGAPAPTMKTLDQIEPRTEINAANTPGDADSIFKITRPGSYYLTGGLAGVAAKHGIEITASDVTLDLMGFALTGVGGSLGGVSVNANVGGLTIRNGTARGWGQSGIGTSNANGCILENLQASGNGFSGILAGENATVRDCTARTNTGAGISAQTGSTIVRCTAGGNTTTGIGGSGFSVTISHCAASSNGGIGIRANNNCTVSDCVSRVNGSHGIEAGDHCVLRGLTSAANTAAARGISAGNGCTINDCTASNNSGDGIVAGDGSALTNCSAQANTGSHGILGGMGSTLTHCSVVNHEGDYGISGRGGCTITGCTARANQCNYGIHADDGSTISDCTACGNTGTSVNTYGIYGGGSVTIIGCTSRDNTNPGSIGNHGVGIFVGLGSVVKDCSASSNGGDGIEVLANCLIEGNTCDFNGSNGVGAGILCTGSRNRIETNTVVNNEQGIKVESAGSLIVRNSAGLNTTNYVIAANNRVGVIVAAPTSAAISGSTGGAGVGSTDPWANFSF